MLLYYYISMLYPRIQITIKITMITIRIITTIIVVVILINDNNNY